MREAATQTTSAPVRIDVELDSDHPTPLYHQIVQALRWKIGTGTVPPGTLLPPLRKAAERWGVSYHTVRRAYQELAAAGFVAPGRGDGTRVLARQDGPDPPAALPAVGEGPDETAPLAVFIQDVVARASKEYGLTPGALAERIARAEPSERPAVALVECNDHQAEDLARQLEARFSVDAIPWNLGWGDEPPDVPLVGTWFHVAEMRRRWPHRIGAMTFAAVKLDPRVIDRIGDALARSETPRPIVFVEVDVGTGHQHAADLAAALSLPERPEVRIAVPALQEVEASDMLLVVAPRLWGHVDPELRGHPRVFNLRHVFEERHLEEVGLALGLR